MFSGVRFFGVILIFTYQNIEKVRVRKRQQTIVNMALQIN